MPVNSCAMHAHAGIWHQVVCSHCPNGVLAMPARSPTCSTCKLARAIRPSTTSLSPSHPQRLNAAARPGAQATAHHPAATVARSGAQCTAHRAAKATAQQTPGTTPHTSATTVHLRQSNPAHVANGQCGRISKNSPAEQDTAESSSRHSRTTRLNSRAKPAGTDSAKQPAAPAEGT